MSKNQGPHELGGQARGMHSLIHPDELPRLALHAFARYSASGLYKPGEKLAAKIVATMKAKVKS